MRVRSRPKAAPIEPAGSAPASSGPRGLRDLLACWQRIGRRLARGTRCGAEGSRSLDLGAVVGRQEPPVAGAVRSARGSGGVRAIARIARCRAGHTGRAGGARLPLHRRCCRGRWRWRMGAGPVQPVQRRCGVDVGPGHRIAGAAGGQRLRTGRSGQPILAARRVPAAPRSTTTSSSAHCNCGRVIEASNCPTRLPGI